MAGILLAVAFVALVAAFVAGTMWFDSYLRSSELLALIERATGNSVRSEARFDPLRWTGSSAFSENWRAAFGGAWRIEDLAITRFDGDFVAPEETVDSTPKSLQPPTGLAALLPRRFELVQARVGSANLSFGRVSARGMRLQVIPDGVGWIIEGAGGNLATPFLPTLGISNFRARFQGREIYLTESALRLGEAGKINAAGDSGSGGILRVSWDEVNSRDIFEAGMRRYLDGKLSGSAEIRPPGAVQGKVRLRDGRIENVPMLGVVADFTGNPSFRRMPLQEMSTDFNCENGTLKLTNFVVESKGLLRIEGAGQRGPGGRIEGRFQIGVMPQTLQWLPGSRERVFTVMRNGYLWADVVIGGTVENPTEDLSARLTAAMGGAIIEQGTNLIKNPTKAVDGAKELLNKDPVKAIDGAKGLLNNFIGPLVP